MSGECVHSWLDTTIATHLVNGSTRTTVHVRCNLSDAHESASCCVEVDFAGLEALLNMLGKSV